MAWEKRARGGSYYYTKERGADGRVRSVYVGGGETAMLISHAESFRREEERIKAAMRRAERERESDIDATLDALAALAESVTVAALIASGYHTHKRQWRKRRHAKSIADEGEGGGRAGQGPF